MHVLCDLVLTVLNSEETTQLRRKATWKKGPTTEHISSDVGRRSMADSVAHMAEPLR